MPTESRPRSAMKPLSLRINFSWIAAGNAVGAISQWGVAIVLARVGSFDMIGLVVLAYAICAPINALGQLGLRSAVVTDAKSEYRFGDYLALRLITATAALVVVVAIAATSIADLQTALVIVVVGVAEMLKSISDIFHGLLQQRERMDRIGMALMIRGPLMLAALTVGVYLTGNLLWGILGFPLVLALVLFAYDIPGGMRMLKASTGSEPSPSGRSMYDTRLRPHWDTGTLVRLTLLTLPLGIILMMVALTTSIPRYMVEHYLGAGALGLFMSIAYVGVVGVRVVSAMAQSAGPRLAKYHASGNTAAYCRLLLRLLILVAGLGVAVILGMALLGAPVLGWLYAADFMPHVRLGVWVMAAAAAMYLTIPLGIAVEAMRRFKTHMVIRGLGIVVLLVLTPPLIQAHGLQGAAAAMLIASGTTAVGCAGVVLWAVRRFRGGMSLSETMQPAVGR